MAQALPPASAPRQRRWSIKSLTGSMRPQPSTADIDNMPSLSPQPPNHAHPSISSPSSSPLGFPSSMSTCAPSPCSQWQVENHLDQGRPSHTQQKQAERQGSAYLTLPTSSPFEGPHSAPPSSLAFSTSSTATTMRTATRSPPTLAPEKSSTSSSSSMLRSASSQSLRRALSFAKPASSSSSSSATASGTTTSTNDSEVAHSSPARKRRKSIKQLLSLPLHTFSSKEGSKTSPSPTSPSASPSSVVIPNDSFGADPETCQRSSSTATTRGAGTAKGSGGVRRSKSMEVVALNAPDETSLLPGAAAVESNLPPVPSIPAHLQQKQQHATPTRSMSMLALPSSSSSLTSSPTTGNSSTAAATPAATIIRPRSTSTSTLSLSGSAGVSSKAHHTPILQLQTPSLSYSPLMPSLDASDNAADDDENGQSKHAQHQNQHQRSASNNSITRTVNPASSIATTTSTMLATPLSALERGDDERGIVVVEQNGRDGDDGDCSTEDHYGRSSFEVVDRHEKSRKMHKPLKQVSDPSYPRNSMVVHSLEERDLLPITKGTESAAHLEHDEASTTDYRSSASWTRNTHSLTSAQSEDRMRLVSSAAGEMGHTVGLVSEQGCWSSEPEERRVEGPVDANSTMLAPESPVNTNHSSTVEAARSAQQHRVNTRSLPLSITLDDAAHQSRSSSSNRMMHTLELRSPAHQSGTDGRDGPLDVPLALGSPLLQRGDAHDLDDNDGYGSETHEGTLEDHSAVYGDDGTEAGNETITEQPVVFEPALRKPGRPAPLAADQPPTSSSPSTSISASSAPLSPGLSASPSAAKSLLSPASTLSVNTALASHRSSAYYSATSSLSPVSPYFSTSPLATSPGAARLSPTTAAATHTALPASSNVSSSRITSPASASGGATTISPRSLSAGAAACLRITAHRLKRDSMGAASAQPENVNMLHMGGRRYPSSTRPAFNKAKEGRRIKPELRKEMAWLGIARKLQYSNRRPTLLQEVELDAFKHLERASISPAASPVESTTRLEHSAAPGKLPLAGMNSSNQLAAHAGFMSAQQRAWAAWLSRPGFVVRCAELDAWSPSSTAIPPRLPSQLVHSARARCWADASLAATPVVLSIPVASAMSATTRLRPDVNATINVGQGMVSQRIPAQQPRNDTFARLKDNEQKSTPSSTTAQLSSARIPKQDLKNEEMRTATPLKKQARKSEAGQAATPPVQDMPATTVNKKAASTKTGFGLGFLSSKFRFRKDLSTGSSSKSGAVMASEIAAADDSDSPESFSSSISNVDKSTPATSTSSVCSDQAESQINSKQGGVANSSMSTLRPAREQRPPVRPFSHVQYSSSSSSSSDFAPASQSNIPASSSFPNLPLKSAMRPTSMLATGRPVSRTFSSADVHKEGQQLPARVAFERHGSNPTSPTMSPDLLVPPARPRVRVLSQPTTPSSGMLRPHSMFVPDLGTRGRPAREQAPNTEKRPMSQLLQLPSPTDQSTNNSRGLQQWLDVDRDRYAPASLLPEPALPAAQPGTSSSPTSLSRSPQPSPPASMPRKEESDDDDDDEVPLAKMRASMDKSASSAPAAGLPENPGRPQLRQIRANSQPRPTSMRSSMYLSTSSEAPPLVPSKSDRSSRLSGAPLLEMDPLLRAQEAQAKAAIREEQIRKGAEEREIARRRDERKKWEDQRRRSAYIEQKAAAEQAAAAEAAKRQSQIYMQQALMQPQPMFPTFNAPFVHPGFYASYQHANYMPASGGVAYRGANSSALPIFAPQQMMHPDNMQAYGAYTPPATPPRFPSPGAGERQTPSSRESSPRGGSNRSSLYSQTDTRSASPSRGGQARVVSGSSQNSARLSYIASSGSMPSLPRFPSQPEGLIHHATTQSDVVIKAAHARRSASYGGPADGPLPQHSSADRGRPVMPVVRATPVRRQEEEERIKANRGSRAFLA